MRVRHRAAADVASLRSKIETCLYGHRNSEIVFAPRVHISAAHIIEPIHRIRADRLQSVSRDLEGVHRPSRGIRDGNTVRPQVAVVIKPNRQVSHVGVQRPPITLVDVPIMVARARKRSTCLQFPHRPLVPPPQVRLVRRPGHIAGRIVQLREARAHRSLREIRAPRCDAPGIQDNAITGEAVQDLVEIPILQPDRNHIVRRDAPVRRKPNRVALRALRRIREFIARQIGQLGCRRRQIRRRRARRRHPDRRRRILGRLRLRARRIHRKAEVRRQRHDRARFVTRQNLVRSFVPERVIAERAINFARIRGAPSFEGALWNQIHRSADPARGAVRILGTHDFHARHVVDRDLVELHLPRLRRRARDAIAVDHDRGRFRRHASHRD